MKKLFTQNDKQGMNKDGFQDEMKTKGNKHFREKQYYSAIECFKSALSIKCTDYLKVAL